MTGSLASARRADQLADQEAWLVAQFRERLQAFEWPLLVDPETGEQLDIEASRAAGLSLLALWDRIVTQYGHVGKRALCKADRFYLLCRVLHRMDAFHPWVYARCREVEANPDGYLDLWAREHYKSTIITFAGSIQEIIKDPEITIGIFSHTSPDAKKFSTQIKGELETNTELQGLFPEVFYAKPEVDSPLWSIEKGITVKRTSNAREATVEAHGVIDSQPVGSHYRLMIFDDLVTALAVSTPDQVKKTTEMHSLADNLGARDPQTGLIRKWHVGTRYHFRDTYQDLIDRKALIPRVYPATHNGEREGVPVFLNEQAWTIKKRDQVSSILAAQMLQNPAAGTEAMFRLDWLNWTEIRPATLNIALMVDPASSKKRSADSTVMHVWGIDAAWNRYLLDGYHHRMSLTERWEALLGLYRKWIAEPGVQMVKVGYERYGSMSDLEYFEDCMKRLGFHFPIQELSWPLESEERSKRDRIQRLEPDFRKRRLFFPFIHKINGVTTREYTALQQRCAAENRAFQILQPTRRIDERGNLYTLHIRLTEEYLPYPYSSHDDGLDCASRWYDMDMNPPTIVDDSAIEPPVYVDGA